MKDIIKVQKQNFAPLICLLLQVFLFYQVIKAQIHISSSLSALNIKHDHEAQTSSGLCRFSLCGQ